MKMPFFPPRRDYALEPLTVADSAAVFALHQEDFVPALVGRGIPSLLEQDTVFGFAAREVGRGGDLPPVGFVLARLAAGEAEILTIAVARSHRRQGLGWRLMDAVLRECTPQRAEALFLEVDETNARPSASTGKLGFHEVGKRPNYYQSARGATGALVMRRDLR